MRVERQDQDRLSGFAVGDKVELQTNMSDGALLVTVGQIERIDRSGVTVRQVRATLPIAFAWSAIRTIGRRAA
jgi:hypothetical protein